MSKIKLIVALVCTFIFGIVLAFVTNIYIKNIKKTQQGIIINNLGNIQGILKLNIQFLRARKAEKNMLLFRNMNYKEEVEFYIREANISLSKLKDLNADNQDVDILFSIENNLMVYNKLFKDLVMSMSSDKYDYENIKLISNDIRELNDMFANNVESLVNTHSIKIRQKLELLDEHFAKVSRFLIIMLPISLVIGFFTGNVLFIYDVV